MTGTYVNIKGYSYYVDLTCVEVISNPDHIQQTTMSKYEELSKLKELLDAGVLSKEEFEAEKKKILDASEEVNPSLMP